MKKAFTLAEIMIVLTIIGVITGILLPIAHNSLPDEKVMKFKKGHATLYKVINELVTSDKYYLDGQFDKKPDGTNIDGENGTVTYFCESFADIISTRSVNCNSTKQTHNELRANSYVGIMSKYSHTLATNASSIDMVCNSDLAKSIGAEIVTSDGITFYQASTITFGMQDFNDTLTNNNMFLETVAQNNEVAEIVGDPTISDAVEGLDSSYRIYKVFCMDIDGINQGEDPFGYGIRADGQIWNGERAQEWLEKDIQDKD